MRQLIRSQSDLIDVKMAAVEGQTRRSVTVVDTRKRREMHLRLGSRLATPESMPRLIGHLRRVIFPDDICVFAGAMPSGGLLESLIGLVETCRGQITAVVVDTYGLALKRFVDTELAWLIAPNVAELSELLGTPVKDTPAKLFAAVRPLLEKVPTILISRGKKGAILVTQKGAWTGQAMTSGKVLETVGCGDYLLAGFLAGYGKSGNGRTALATALKVATARAFGWAESGTWAKASRSLDVAVEPL
jgi:fructose-1-phosphate kinase PfkB-like protein